MPENITMDALKNLAKQLGDELNARGMILALAESCTGGMAAMYVTAISGSSQWFDRGIVSYSNQAKMDLLKVNQHTLTYFGAVSEQTAQEMARGVLQQSQAHIAGSITGIAGPDGGTPEKPVGTVCFAWLIDGKQMATATKIFQGDRQAIRQQAVEMLFQGLLRYLA